MDLTIDFNDTNIKTIFVPIVASLLTIAILRLSGAWRGSALAQLSIGIGFLASYFLTMGLPLWPVASVLGLLPFVVVAGMVVGVLLDLNSAKDSTLTLLHISVSLGLVFWVASLWHGGGIQQSELVLYGVLILSGFWAMQRLHHQRDEGVAPAISLLTACIGITVVATIYGTRTSLFSTGLAAACVGFIVWNWPNCRYPWGSSATLVGGSVYIVLASELAIKNPALALPIGLTLLSFIIFDITNRLFPVNSVFQPFIQLIFSAFPIALAAYFTQNP
jgi:hypothetical protein